MYAGTWTEIAYHLNLPEKLNFPSSRTEQQSLTETTKGFRFGSSEWNAERKKNTEREMRLFTGHKFSIDIFTHSERKSYDTME